MVQGKLDLVQDPEVPVRHGSGRVKKHVAAKGTGESDIVRGKLDLVQDPEVWVCHGIGDPLKVKWAEAHGDTAPQSDTCSTCSLGYMHPYRSGVTDSEPTSPMLPIPFEAHFRNGSSRHDSGHCKPCAWYWKPGGCRNGEECGYCHLCPVDEIKKRKRAKITEMQRAKEVFHYSDEHDEVNCSMFQEGKNPGKEIQSSNVTMEEAERQTVSNDQGIVAHQQHIIVKNTFIHVEFEDVPQASRVCDTDHFIVSAGIIFTAFDWKHSFLPFA